MLSGAVGADNPPNVARKDSTPGTTDTSLGGAVRTISGLTLVSRVCGLIRDLITARVFQDTLIGSAFAAAFAIPNLFRRLLGEGALAAAFLPEYAREADEDPKRAGSLLAITLYALLALTSLLTIAGELGILLILTLFEHDADRVFSLRLVMVLLPFMPMVCIAAIMAAALQVHGRFGPGAASPIILNALIISAALLHFVGPQWDRHASAYAIGIGALIAGLAQIAWCAAALRGKVRWKGSLLEAHEPLRRVLGRFLPVAIGLGAIQLNALLDTIIAMWPTWFGPTMFGMATPLDERSNAILSYTQRLYQFPLGVFGIAVATAAFPALSRLAGDGERFARAVGEAMRLSLFIALPASVGLVLVREDLTRVLFGGASGFSDDGLTRSASVLLGYGVGVWAYSLNHVLVRGFYARGDTRTPMLIALGAVALNLSLNLLLIWPLGEAGLAWSTAASQVVQVCVLGFLLRRRDGMAHAGRGVPAMIGATSVMASLVYATGRLMGEPASWGGSLARLGAMTVIGFAAYLALAAWTRSDELRLLLRRTR